MQTEDCAAEHYPYLVGRFSFAAGKTSSTSFLDFFVMSSNSSEEDSHVPDYDEARSDLFNEIFARHGMSSFQLYWSSFRRFIIGQLSKEEFDIVVKNVLSDDKGTF